MVTELENYLSAYLNTRANMLKSYLLSALDKGQNLLSFESFKEPKIPDPDVQNCEFLEEVGLFTEEFAPSQNSNRSHRIFHLTEVGKMLATELKQESAQTNLKISLSKF